MKTKVVLFAIILLVAIFGFVFLTKQHESLGEVEVELHYMSYACGDCHSQYKIESIKSSSLKLDSLLGKEISASFSAEMEKEIEQKAERCMICFNYMVIGDLYLDSEGEYLIKAKECVLVETHEGCCSEGIVAD